MLYSSGISEMLYNMQEPFRFFAFFGMILLLIGLLCLNGFIEKKEINKMEQRIIAENKRRKKENPNCHIIYKDMEF